MQLMEHETNDVRSHLSEHHQPVTEIEAVIQPRECLVWNDAKDHELVVHSSSNKNEQTEKRANN